MITESTTISIALALSVGGSGIGLAFWLTKMYAQGKSNTKGIKNNTEAIQDLEKDMGQQNAKMEAKMDEQYKAVTDRLKDNEKSTNHLQVSIARLEEKIEQVPEKIRALILENK